MCLNTFLINLREPKKTAIRLREPTTIEQAYELCEKEHDFYSQFKNQNHDNRHKQTPYLRPDVPRHSNKNNNFHKAQNNNQHKTNSKNNNSPFNQQNTFNRQVQNISQEQSFVDLCNIADKKKFK